MSMFSDAKLYTIEENKNWTRQEPEEYLGGVLA